jgi:hypothetical protein
MLAEQPSQLTGTLTVADVVRFQYCHADRVIMIAILLLVFALVGILAVLSRGGAGSFTNPGSSYVIMLCWGLLLLGISCLAARKHYRKQQFLREPMLYHFTEDGVRLEGPAKVAWTLVQ